MVGQRGGIHDLVLTLRDFSMDCDLTKVALWALNEVCRDSPSNVARLHIEQLGVKLTRLSETQAEYIDVPMDGPYKPDHYRY